MEGLWELVASVVAVVALAAVAALFAVGVLPFHASGTAGCQSVPARYGGVECLGPSPRFNIGSGEVEWE